MTSLYSYSLPQIVSEALPHGQGGVNPQHDIALRRKNTAVLVVLDETQTLAKGPTQQSCGQRR